MIAVAILAPFLMALRDDAEGSLPAGIVIVVACVVVLARKLTVDAIARGEADGSKPGRWRQARIVLVSSMVAVAIIGAADLAFLIVYEIDIAMMYYFPPKSDRFYKCHIQPSALRDGAFAAAGVVVLRGYSSGSRSGVRSGDPGSGGPIRLTMIEASTKRRPELDLATGRPRFTIGQLMITVAVVALLLMVLRDDAEGSPLGGVLIVAACVVVLAYKLTVDAISRDQAGGNPPGQWRIAFLALASFAIAFGVIGLADFSFLLVSGLVVGIVDHPSYSLQVGGVIVGVLFVVIVTTCLRHAIQSKREIRRRPRPPDGFSEKINPREWK